MNEVKPEPKPKEEVKEYKVLRGLESPRGTVHKKGSIIILTDKEAEGFAEGLIEEVKKKKRSLFARVFNRVGDAMFTNNREAISGGFIAIYGIFTLVFFIAGDSLLGLLCVMITTLFCVNLGYQRMLDRRRDLMKEILKTNDKLLELCNEATNIVTKLTQENEELKKLKN